MEMSSLARDGTTEPVSRDQSLRHDRGQGNIRSSCSADHAQDWKPYPVDPSSCYLCDHTQLYTYINRHVIPYMSLFCERLGAGIFQTRCASVIVYWLRLTVRVLLAMYWHSRGGRYYYY